MKTKLISFIAIFLSLVSFGQSPSTRTVVDSWWNGRVVPITNYRMATWLSFYNVIDNPATGTGSVVLSTTPSISNPVINTGSQSAGQILVATNTLGACTWSTVSIGGGGGSPGGSTSQLQFNNAGAFGGSSNLTFTNSTLALTGSLTVTGTETLGGLILQNGSQGAGKVLTSDANGVATWSTSSATSLGNLSTVGSPLTAIDTLGTPVWISQGHNSGINFRGKAIYFFGDSYIYGTGVSTLSRWSNVFCNSVNAIEVNNGIPSTTLEKRAPIIANNMIDNISLIPVKSPTISMLVFAYGLNDMGNNFAAYNTTNYKADYATVLNAALAKGWQRSQILLVPPYYIGALGRAAYAASSGTTTPSVARHYSFVRATLDVAAQFGCMSFDIYTHIKNNDTTLIAGDNIHPTVAGHFYIANDVLSFFSRNAIDESIPVAGSNTQIQYNNGGVLAGSNNLTLDNTGVLTVGSSNQINLYANQPSINELTGRQIITTNNGGLAIIPPIGGVGTVIMGYYDGSLYRSAVEIANTSGLGNLKLMRSGGTISTAADVSITGSVNISNTLLVGGNTAATDVKGSATLDFPSTAAGSVSDLTVTVTGASDGDPISIGVKNSSIPAGGSFYAWVSATDIVTIRFVNNSLVTAFDPTSNIYKVTVFKN